jgi:hypothetical protein
MMDAIAPEIGRATRTYLEDRAAKVRLARVRLVADASLANWSLLGGTISCGRLGIRR